MVSILYIDCNVIDLCGVFGSLLYCYMLALITTASSDI
jgi:hypothetical protein